MEVTDATPASDAKGMGVVAFELQADRREIGGRHQREFDRTKHRLGAGRKGEAGANAVFSIALPLEASAMEVTAIELPSRCASTTFDVSVTVRPVASPGGQLSAMIH